MPTRRTARTVRAGSIGALTLLSTACHTYASVDPQAVAAGREARVRLTDRGRADLAPVIGPRSSSITGLVVRQDDSLVVMSVAAVTRDGGITETWRSESVSFPRSAIAGIDVPRFAAGRSALLAGGIVAGAVLLGTAISGGGGAPGGGGGTAGRSGGR